MRIQREVPTVPSTTTLYQRLKDAGATLDNHASDLYVLATPKAREIIFAYFKELGRPTVLSMFRSQIDGEFWYDLPFMYAPFWDAVEQRRQRDAREA
jgi:hypothetical protein